MLVECNLWRGVLCKHAKKGQHNNISDDMCFIILGTTPGLSMLPSNMPAALTPWQCSMVGSFFIAFI
jgi:hypothetical protein